MRMLVLLLSVCLLGGNAFGQLLRLKVSDNQRSIVTSDGKPFFWLGDTGWELFHRLGRGEAAAYFKKRSEQGFTVIQAVALPELDGLRTPNANGDLPFTDTGFTKPNERYFAYIDTLMDVAASYGLYIALLPTWGDKVFKDWWGTGPEIWHPDNIYVYGKWIGARFRNKANLIWIIGGDRDPRPGSADVAVWRSLAKGVTEGVGGADKALMTFHPQPKGTGSSSQWFQQDEWLDVNMLQTGHCRDTEVWETIANDYGRTPVKPVLNGENIYEEMPVCFNAKELGWASAYDVRKAAYLSVFAGGCGHTYGCGPVIFFGPKGSNLFADLHGWKEALDLAGANEMKYLRTLIESRPMLERVPAQALLGSEGGCGAERIQATRGKDYAFVYSAHGREIVVNANAGLGSKVDAGWYDPRTGKKRYIGSFDNSKALTFTPPLPANSPVPSHREDWVLVLDDAAAKRW